jgi:hypothetical protein
LEGQPILRNEFLVEIDIVEYQAGQGQSVAELGTGRSHCR